MFGPYGGGKWYTKEEIRIRNRNFFIGFWGIQLFFVAVCIYGITVKGCIN